MAAYVDRGAERRLSGEAVERWNVQMDCFISVLIMCEGDRSELTVDARLWILTHFLKYFALTCLFTLVFV